MPELTFKMPLLSKYICYMDGTIISNSPSKHSNYTGFPMSLTKRGNSIYYTVKTDYGETTTITREEIMQYGKHVKLLTTLTHQYGALKYRDAMEQFNKIT